jgi:hypothetical protein
MKTASDTCEEESRALLESAEGYIELELWDMAESEISLAESRFGETSTSQRLKCRIAGARGNYEEIGRVARKNLDNSSDAPVDLFRISISGDPRWVYERCLGFEAIWKNDYLYWFNRACFASLIGKLDDALASLQLGFCRSTQKQEDAFFDSDLDPLWNWIAKVSMSDGLAELLVYPVWQQAITNQDRSLTEILLPPAMAAVVPERFRPFLVHDEAMLRASRKISASLYREYRTWQKEVTRSNAAKLEIAIQRAREFLINRQPRFALHQINRGNLTAARYHILYYLSHRPQEFSRLRFLDNLGMGYLMRDLAPAHEEDPNYFRKMESVALSYQCSLDDFEVIGKIGQDTALYQTRLAGYEIANDLQEQGCQRLLRVVHRWPDDAITYSRLVDAYIALERWEEARLSFRAAPAHYKRFRRCEEQLLQIKEESIEVVKNGPPTCKFLGQRDLGGRLVDGTSSGKREGC